MNEKSSCPSIYEDIFSKPVLIEQLILITYSLIFLVGLVGNIMTIIIIQFNAHLRTATNYYLLNLAVSDLMMLICNLPLEMLEIYHRQWPLSVVFCKLRNICAEFFTCSSILTILAFTCERYFAIVYPVHLHRLSHFRRSRNVIVIIWIVSLGFSLPLGLAYEIQPDQVSSSSTSCKSCVPKKSLAKILSIIILLSSVCLFYLPMFIIGAIYLFIGKALRRVNRYEVNCAPMEYSSTSQSSKDIATRKEKRSNFHSMYSGASMKTGELHRQGSQTNSSTRLKMQARWQARQVVVKTLGKNVLYSNNKSSFQNILVVVVIAFFVCYAPLYLQRVVVAIMTLTPNDESTFLANFIAYLYVISGVTFYLGSVINPILYNVVSNKYRRAFRDLFCCRLKSNEKTWNHPPPIVKKQFQILPIHYFDHSPLHHPMTLNVLNQGNIYSTKSNTSSLHYSDKNKRFLFYK